MSAPEQKTPIYPDYWRPCSSCKKPIKYKTGYWVCNVSTCSRKRTGLVFCDVSCWDAHLPLMNHRESWAEDRKSPTYDEWVALVAAESEPKKRVSAPRASAPISEEIPKPAGPKVLLRRTRAEE